MIDDVMYSHAKDGAGQRCWWPVLLRVNINGGHFYE